MNRSFRMQEQQMGQASLQQRKGRSLGSAMKEKEEELALFLEMRKREKERSSMLLLQSPDELETPLGSKVGSSPLFKITSPPPRKTAADEFLNSEGEKNDYDWLLTPPGTPLFPSLDTESNKVTVMSQIGTPKVRQAALKSRLSNPQPEPASRVTSLPRPTSSSSLHSTNSVVRRPSSSGGPASAKTSRPSTPTSRPTLPATSRSSRSSTPTSRPTLPSSKTASVAKPTTSLVKPSTGRPRSSTPTSRPTLPSTRSASRSSTPTRRPATPSNTTTASAAPARSSSVSKTAPPKSTVPARGISPTVKSRPWKPSDMPGFSLDAPPNLRTSMPERPLSASRGRPGAPSSRSSSIEPVPNGRPRRQSCSPSRGRAPNGIKIGPGSYSSTTLAHSNGSKSPSPVVIGSKMVERVINMRKLPPPKRDDQESLSTNLAGKSSSSPDSSGFGRTLSKKSLDMALRHMDIRSIPGSLRPLMTNIPASSVYSVRSGPTRNRTISVSDSPLATSSNCSSEQSVSNRLQCTEGFETVDDLGSERGILSSHSSPHLR